MNWRHFRAFVWLRWRLMANQWRRAGALSAVLMVIISVGALVTAIPLFIGCFAIATYTIPKSSPDQLMYVWDGLLFFFLLFWGIGLITELQRNDPLALSKFLHLPVSVQSAFLINYLSSLVRLSLVFFVPIMAGFALALVYVQGVEQLPTLLSLVAFLLMITGLTYQFQGWLSSLMSNPRLRRTIIVATTMGFVLIFQLPNLINLYIPKQLEQQQARTAAMTAEMGKLQVALASQEIDNPEYLRRQKEIQERFQAESKRASDEESARWSRMARIANMALPVGWLPMGVMYSAEGRVIPSLLGLSGMTLIGLGSLWRAYRTTLKQFLGQSTNRESKAPAPRAVADGKPRGRFLEIRLPGLSEPVSAIALGGFRSILRSPEAKISLLTPIIMGVIFGSVLLRGRQGMPESLRPLTGIASIAFVFFGLLQVMCNQFGLDRDGFRVFVLCAAPRRDILLGKNLSYAPMAALLAAIFLTAVQVISPMRLDHALSMIPQFFSMYMLFCMLANLVSIYAPVYIAAGTLKPANPKMSTVLLQLLMIFLIFPLLQAVTLLPFGVAALSNAYGWGGRVPICLLLTLLECVAIFFLYMGSLHWLGGQLQAREQKILEVVTNRGL